MKILFLHSELEWDRNGITDATRSLARGMRQTGHQTAFLSVSQKTEEGKEVVDGSPVLKLLPIWRDRDRFNQARQFITDFSPDWISLQFVSYGFSPKGTVFGLGSQLAELLKGYNKQVFFHEIWIGPHLGAPWKHRLWGAIQKRSIQQFIQQLKPEVIHCSNQTFQFCLKKAGISSGVLSLTSGIPISEECEELKKDIQHEFFKLLNETRCGDFHSWSRLGIFGALHPEWPCEPLFEQWIRESRRLNRTPVFASVGNMGPGKDLWNELRGRYDSSIRFVCFGPRSKEWISAYLRWLDAGVATTPSEILGKSSTVRAMLDHGLPVIVNRFQPLGLPSDLFLDPHPLLHRVRAEQTLSLEQLRRGSPDCNAEEIARRLVADLTFATSIK